MPEHLTLSEISKLLADPAELADNAFEVVRGISNFRNQSKDDSKAQELILRALERREVFGESSLILDALVRQIGLFPYLDPRSLGLADMIAYEFHRPVNMEDEEVVFHEVQAMV